MTIIKENLDGKDIALILIALGILCILATHIIETIVSLFLFLTVLLIAAYFILPRLGITALAALIGMRK